MIQNPFIVNMVGHFQDDTALYMVIEYVQGGELYSHLRREVRFSDEKSKFYAMEIVLAFSYLHNLKIIYRDLKPEVSVECVCVECVCVEYVCVCYVG